MHLSALEELIESGNAAAIDNLLHSNPSLATQKTSHGISPLLLACYYHKTQAVKTLLNHLTKIDIYEAAAANIKEEVERLLFEDPSLLNKHAVHGFTPLAMATHFGNTEIVQFLLKKGADPNLASKNGYFVFPLHTAIDGKFDTIAKMLIDAGADINCAQAAQMTPLHFAASSGNIPIIITLLELGASLQNKNENGMTPRTWQERRDTWKLLKY